MQVVPSNTFVNTWSKSYPSPPLTKAAASVGKVYSILYNWWDVAPKPGVAQTRILLRIRGVHNIRMMTRPTFWRLMVRNRMKKSTTNWDRGFLNVLAPIDGSFERSLRFLWSFPLFGCSRNCIPFYSVRSTYEPFSHFARCHRTQFWFSSKVFCANSGMFSLSRTRCAFPWVNSREHAAVPFLQQRDGV